MEIKLKDPAVVEGECAEPAAGSEVNDEEHEVEDTKTAPPPVMKTPCASRSISRYSLFSQSLRTSMGTILIFPTPMSLTKSW